MEDLFIERTEDTPEVSFRAIDGILEIQGRSLPENADEFYRPLIQWIGDFMQQKRIPNTTFRIRLDYLNSSSNRFLLELLHVIEKCSHEDTPVNIVWESAQDDEMMIEKGEDIAALIQLPFDMRLIQG